MNMKDMIQRMTDLENEAKQQLNESLDECGTMPPAPMDRGNPVSVTVSMNASGREHVEDLLDMMKQAGLGGAKEVAPDMMPMRTDMERLRDIVDGPKALPAPRGEDIEEAENNYPHLANFEELYGIQDKEMYKDMADDAQSMDIEEFEDTYSNVIDMAGDFWEDHQADVEEGYDNEPDEQYDDHETMIHDLSGGINRKKKSYKAAEPGDNAMAVESDDEDKLSKKLFKRKPGELDKLSREKNRKMNQKNFIKPGKPKRSGEWNTYESDMVEDIAAQLYAMLSEKKAKPDYIDIDGDGDKKEPMKKAAKDAKKEKTNEGMPSSVIKHKQKLANMSSDELAQKLSNKSDDELRMMARRHGYGKDTEHYINRIKKARQ